MIAYFQSIWPYFIYIFFILGFVLLVKGADWLVDGAAAIAKRFNVSDIVIGLTIVSFGTSAPELVVNLIASFNDTPDIAIGNILGSNIANILLILGVAGVIYPLTVNANTTWKEIPMSIMCALMVGLLANDVFFDQGPKPILSRSDGLVMIAFFIVFVYYTVGLAMRGEALDDDDEEDTGEGLPMPKAIAMTVAGMFMLPIGGDWIVQGAVHVAKTFGVTEAVISLTIIAIGTSLPEVAASVAAALKRRTDIAIGNAVGSNIFNVFWVLGLSSVIRPLPYNPASNRDVFMAAGASLLLMLFLFVGKRRVLQKWQGAFFLILYAVYITYLAVGGK